MHRDPTGAQNAKSRRFKFNILNGDLQIDFAVDDGAPIHSSAPVESQTSVQTHAPDDARSEAQSDEEEDADHRCFRARDSTRGNPCRRRPRNAPGNRETKSSVSDRRLASCFATPTPPPTPPPSAPIMPTPAGHPQQSMSQDMGNQPAAHQPTRTLVDPPDMTPLSAYRWYPETWQQWPSAAFDSPGVSSVASGQSGVALDCAACQMATDAGFFACSIHRTEPPLALTADAGADGLQQVTPA